MLVVLIPAIAILVVSVVMEVLYYQDYKATKHTVNILGMVMWGIPIVTTLISLYVFFFE